MGEIERLRKEVASNHRRAKHLADPTAPIPGSVRTAFVAPPSLAAASKPLPVFFALPIKIGNAPAGR